MAKEASLFVEEVGRIFPKLQNIIDKVNDKRQAPSYLYESMLKKTYSADDTWEAGSVNTSRVAADIVSMDSPLPLKTRPTVAYANGKLPKLGMALTMKESELKAVDLMKARGEKWANIANKLTQDPVACHFGIKERNEYNFLFGLSNGYVVVPDPDKASLGHRFNFKYYKRNLVGVATANTLTVDDIEKVITMASEQDGNTITKMMLSLVQYNKLRQTAGAKELVADYRGIVVTSTSKLSVPTKSIFNEAMKDKYGVDIIVVDRVVRFEKNGVVEKKRPWNDNRVIYLTDDQAGSFVYGTVAEANHKVDGVTYQELDGYILVSKFANSNPLREMTGVQAEALPVIEDVDKLYITDIATTYAARVSEESSTWDDEL